MTGFQHHTAELRLHCGERALEALPRELDRLACRRAIVFCGTTLSQPGGALDRVAQALGDRLAEVFRGVLGHSPVASVEEGAARIANARADAVVALGGGSAIVTARAASVLAAEGGRVSDLASRIDGDGRMRSPRLGKPKLPQFVLPTTPTTACVKAGSAVQGADGDRLALFDPKTRAKAVFIDHALLATAPAALVCSAALNALAMAVEGLESQDSDPLSDALLMHALRLLAQDLPAMRDEPHDASRRARLVLAAVLCGQGTDQAGGGLASVLGHAIGHRSQVPNGIVNAIVLPHTMRFNLPATHERLWKVRASLPPSTGAEPTTKVIEALESLFVGLGLPRHLRDTGLQHADFDGVVADAGADHFLQRNPRRVEGPAQLRALLEACW
ncbi:MULTISPECIES: iron-containing alcohol dehydrogenase family protein [unclassified Variovorax]|uniref:iron-containing alcohol dehydrogenase family protein n=1 Tax=unclassified Variovorax TaxID=663243 RepID=UPI000839A7CB|nr:MULTISPECIES: iron-containing alcohol dehydrogenase family protein [unclassified Variovorax]PNG52279.1 Lactaldehyde reductase [Variovorax sp. B4]PNG54819.1 Lactaldehyde reductase [Variovorax sp. B2]VTV15826.1 Lactaldehyde reductase [Variovorax sp. WDL1]